MIILQTMNGAREIIALLHQLMAMMPNDPATVETLRQQLFNARWALAEISYAQDCLCAKVRQITDTLTKS